MEDVEDFFYGAVMLGRDNDETLRELAAVDDGRAALGDADLRAVFSDGIEIEERGGRGAFFNVEPGGKLEADIVIGGLVAAEADFVLARFRCEVGGAAFLENRGLEEEALAGSIGVLRNPEFIGNGERLSGRSGAPDGDIGDFGQRKKFGHLAPDVVLLLFDGVVFQIVFQLVGAQAGIVNRDRAGEVTVGTQREVGRPFLERGVRRHHRSRGVNGFFRIRDQGGDAFVVGWEHSVGNPDAAGVQEEPGRVLANRDHGVAQQDRMAPVEAGNKAFAIAGSGQAGIDPERAGERNEEMVDVVMPTVAALERVGRRLVFFEFLALFCGVAGGDEVGVLDLGDAEFVEAAELRVFGGGTLDECFCFLGDVLPGFRALVELGVEFPAEVCPEILGSGGIIGGIPSDQPGFGLNGREVERLLLVGFDVGHFELEAAARIELGGGAAIVDGNGFEAERGVGVKVVVHQTSGMLVLKSHPNDGDVFVFLGPAELNHAAGLQAGQCGDLGADARAIGADDLLIEDGFFFEGERGPVWFVNAGFDAGDARGGIVFDFVTEEVFDPLRVKYFYAKLVFVFGKKSGAVVDRDTARNDFGAGPWIDARGRLSRFLGRHGDPGRGGKEGGTGGEEQGESEAEEHGSAGAGNLAGAKITGATCRGKAVSRP